MILDFLFKRNPKHPPLSADDFEVRIWGFVVIAVTLMLCFIVVSLLYSVTFVTQPIKSMAPIDQAYTKMLNDIVLLIVGGIGGVMSKRAVGAAGRMMNQPKPPHQPQPCQPQQYQQYPQQTQYAYAPQPAENAMPDFNWMGYKNPDLDESWTPGPPPTTPPDYQEPEEDRAEIAAARKEAT
jgi:hypothetical protein